MTKENRVNSYRNNITRKD